MNESDIIQIYIPNGTVKSVRYDFDTKVQKIVGVVLEAIGIDRASYGHFALRLIQFPVANVCTNNTDCHWLPACLTMRHIFNKYFSTDQSPQLRFELRLRFVPKSLKEMYRTETDAFMFLHDQILADYLAQISWKMPSETALELAALQLRIKLGKQNQCAVEKCLNIDKLETDGSLTKYLPKAMLINIKTKFLKKSLAAGIKRHAADAPGDCALMFLEIVQRITQFDVEIFKASLGPCWKIPVEVMVGLNVGIGYSCDNRSGFTQLAQLQNITDIKMKKFSETSEKIIVEMTVSGSLQNLFITLPNYVLAESFAHLINGYNMSLSHRGSVWTPNDLIDEQKMQEGTPSFGHHSTDWIKSIGSTLCIDRSRVMLEKLLGEGQFGSVYQGTYSLEDNVLEGVAVKVCKIESDESERHNFLEEAFVMRRFHHEHIIALIGICMETPIWIVMELAPLGELLFGKQLSSAITYLHECKFLHRDIAARNVLVSSSHSVKLSDFGLSRSIDDEDLYTSTHGKLPIKWMAPESINYRRFSMASDVWMFGVCMWEIFVFGMKPWQGVRNHNVILKIESGERLGRPEDCPKAFHKLLLKMWSFEPSKRPTIYEVHLFICHLLDQIDSHVPFEMLEPYNYEDNLPVRKNACRHSKVASVLKVDDASVIPISTLWQTLEQQKIQSAEDDRWLEEEEEKLLPPPALSTVRNQNSNLLSRNCQISDGTDSVADMEEFERLSNVIRELVFKIVANVTCLSREFSPSMSVAKFSELVGAIKDGLDSLLNQSTECVKLFEASGQKELKLFETLLKSDSKSLSKNMAKTIEEIVEEHNEVIRFEVLKITHRIALNCKHYLESMDDARLCGRLLKSANGNTPS